jgi:hypothetical protein
MRIARRSSAVLAALALFATVAGCGNDQFSPGTPSGLDQAAAGGTPSGGGTGGGSTGGGSTAGGTLKLVGMTNETGLGPLSLFASAGLLASPVDEAWIIVHDPAGRYATQAARQAITVQAFQPGTTTPASGTIQSASLGLASGVLIAVQPLPTTSVDFFVDDTQGNTGTLKATLPYLGGGMDCLSPADAAVSTAGTNVGLSPRMDWTAGLGGGSHLLVVWGTPGIFTGTLETTLDFPVVVETDQTSFQVGSSSAGTGTVFGGGPLPAQNSASATTWEWYVAELDPNGWAVDGVQWFFDMKTN